MTSGRPAAAAGARRLATLALVCAAFAQAPLRGQATDLARAVKATYLYKFAPFVEWPPSAFVSPAAPLRICVVGDDELGELARRGAAGQRVAGREIAVELRRELDPIADCQILFVGGGDEGVAARTLAAARGLPILTVTEAGEDEAEASGGDHHDPGAGERGIVHFVLREDRVRFEIDLALAEAGSLRISPSVLELAARVSR